MHEGLLKKIQIQCSRNSSITYCFYIIAYMCGHKDMWFQYMFKSQYSGFKLVNFFNERFLLSFIFTQELFPKCQTDHKDQIETQIL